jgi:hypothetical protein
MFEVYAGAIGEHESNVTPGKDDGELVEDHGDGESSMDVDDNGYATPPE